MDNAEIAEVIDKSIDYLREHGWTQNTVQDLAGRVCMMSAVYAVFEHNDLPHSGYQAVSNELRKYIGGSPIGYNDTPGRTKKEVIETMKATAKGLRNAA